MTQMVGATKSVIAPRLTLAVCLLDHDGLQVVGGHLPVPELGEHHAVPKTKPRTHSLR